MNTAFVLSILYKAWSRYSSVSSSCVLYCARRIKSTIAQAQYNAPGSFVESNGTMTGINCLMIAFCLTPVHCLTSLKRLKRLRPVKAGTHRKHSSSCMDSEDSLIVLPCRFLLRTAGKSVLVRLCTHIIRLDWPDRTMRLRPDRTGLICKQSGPKFWDRTVVRSYGLVQSKL